MCLHILLGPCCCVYIALFGSRLLLPTVTNTINALFDDGVTAPKHVGVVLMLIFT